MGRLQDKVAIVTGGAGGIGGATARKLGREGAAVAVVDINGEGADRVAAEIKAAGGQAVGVQTDLSQESAVVAMVAAAVAAFGRLDVLHNNAALTESDFLSRDTAVTELSLDVWDRAISVNLSSQMLTCKHAIPEMEKHGGGSIINMSSGAAFSGDRVRTAYGVSKAGVHTLTMYVATSHGKKNIRANTIVPGLIITDAVRGAHSGKRPGVTEPGHPHAPPGRARRHRRPRCLLVLGRIEIHHGADDRHRWRHVRPCRPRRAG